MAPELGPEDEAVAIAGLLEVIHQRYGYDLRGYAPASMRRRVLAALGRSRLGSIVELGRALAVEPALFAAVFADLTVRVSELFRDPPFQLALRRHVLPILATYPLLRIWHAGCAAGEEAYSSAILLSEAGLYERTMIYATDVSDDAIAEAKLGLYRAESLQRFADNYAAGGGRGDLSRYCTVGYGGVAMAPALRRNIVFLQHDLVSDQVFGEMHVVFCRNVLIYFGKELRQRVLDKLVESLAPGGFLCLGATERLSVPAGERGRLGEMREHAAPGIYRHA